MYKSFHQNVRDLGVRGSHRARIWMQKQITRHLQNTLPHVIKYLAQARSWLGLRRTVMGGSSVKLGSGPRMDSSPM